MELRLEVCGISFVNFVSRVDFLSFNGDLSLFSLASVWSAEGMIVFLRFRCFKLRFSRDVILCVERLCLVRGETL